VILIEEFVTVEMLAFQVDPAHVDARISSKMLRWIANLSQALETQQQIEFQDIVTNDESWIYLDTSLNWAWIEAREKVPARPRKTMESSKAMLTVL
jgi:uncharacterized protein YchJ